MTIANMTIVAVSMLPFDVFVSSSSCVGGTGVFVGVGAAIFFFSGLLQCLGPVATFTTTITALVVALAFLATFTTLATSTGTVYEVLYSVGTSDI